MKRGIYELMGPPFIPVILRPAVEDFGNTSLQLHAYYCEKVRGAGTGTAVIRLDEFLLSGPR